METSVITNIVNEYESLSFEDKQYVVEIFQKQLIETKRDEIKKRAEEANKNLQINNVKKGTGKDLYSDLEND
jgi:hypothetical protein